MRRERKPQEPKEYCRCRTCLRLIPVRINTIKVPDHRDRWNPSEYCPGSGEPIHQIIKRRHFSLKPNSYVLQWYNYETHIFTCAQRIITLVFRPESCAHR